jgi:hypothetical protein
LSPSLYTGNSLLTSQNAIWNLKSSMSLYLNQGTTKTIMHLASHNIVILIPSSDYTIVSLNLAAICEMTPCE